MHKYVSPRLHTKLLVLFGKKEIKKELNDKFHLIFHSIKIGYYSNEVYLSGNRVQKEELEKYLKVKNKGVLYFTNYDWEMVKNRIPSKNWNYIVNHHFYVNGSLYGEFIKLITKDIKVEGDNLNMVYVLFGLLTYGKKLIYVNKENMIENGLVELYNVLHKINLIKNISL